MSKVLALLKTQITVVSESNHTSSTQLNLIYFSVLTNMQHFSTINQPSFYVSNTNIVLLAFLFCQNYDDVDIICTDIKVRWYEKQVEK